MAVTVADPMPIWATGSKTLSTTSSRLLYQPEVQQLLGQLQQASPFVRAVVSGEYTEAVEQLVHLGSYWSLSGPAQDVPSAVDPFGPVFVQIARTMGRR
jgi:hypothetical protein